MQHDRACIINAISSFWFILYAWSCISESSRRTYHWNISLDAVGEQYYMRDRAFPNLLAVRITEIFLLMLLVNNIICVTVHFLLSPRTYHSNISLNGVCELAFLCLTGNYIIYKLDNKTCNPVNMKKKRRASWQRPWWAHRHSSMPSCSQLVDEIFFARICWRC
jgi:hypothetical protein